LAPVTTIATALDVPATAPVGETDVTVGAEIVKLTELVTN
jgi:hypothetical protein